MVVAVLNPTDVFYRLLPIRWHCWIYFKLSVRGDQSAYLASAWQSLVKEGRCVFLPRLLTGPFQRLGLPWATCQSTSNVQFSLFAGFLWR